MVRRAPPSPLDLSGQATAGKRNKFAPPTIPEPLVLPPSPRIKSINTIAQPWTSSRLPLPLLPGAALSVMSTSMSMSVSKSRAVAISDPTQRNRGGRPRLELDIPLTPSPYLPGHASSSSSSGGPLSLSISAFSPAGSSSSSSSTSPGSNSARTKRRLPPWLTSSGSFAEDVEREVDGLVRRPRPCEAGFRR